MNHSQVALSRRHYPRTLAGAGLGLLLIACPLLARAQTTERISVSTSGTQANAASGVPSLSAQGRFVAFSSLASNLVTGDTNGVRDVFLRDRNASTTICLSQSAAGVLGNGISQDVTLSLDGRYATFDSAASNLVANDTNTANDVFLKDILTGAVELLSVSTANVQGNGLSEVPFLSADNRYVVFDSVATNLVPNDTNGRRDVFLRDRLLRTTTRISLDANGNQLNGDSFTWGISADGKVVVMQSDATNFVPLDTNGVRDVFTKELATGKVDRISVSTAGVQANTLSGNDGVFISSNGRYVAFSTDASNLVPGDTNATDDVFVRDRLNKTTTRASVSSDGTQSDDGSYAASISADGRYIGFDGFATNLVTGDTNGASDAFIHDLVSGATIRVSVSTAGGQGAANSTYPILSADGRTVTFRSGSSNLVSGDTNATTDVFVRTPLLPAASVTATLDFDNLNPSAPNRDVVISVRDTNSDLLYPLVVSVPAAGNLTVPEVPQGDYSFHIATAKHLAVNQSVNVGVDGADLGEVFLPGGDATGDNAVNFDDFQTLADAYFTQKGVDDFYNPNADFNEDGEVNFDDFQILADNYFLEGDP